MPSPVAVTIHPSQFPGAVQKELLRSLRTRRINHKFHYDSVRQTQKWLALHEAHSPARRDDDCLATYEHAFVATAARIKNGRIQVVGLGCGGGQKDAQLLKLLRPHRQELFYAPCDVSAPMVLVAREAALAILPGKSCFPFACDLAVADDLSVAMQPCLVPRAFRIVTFFGMIPNFEPQQILPKLAALIRPDDFLLFSANLAPGPDYAAGVKKVLPQYDNPLTRDWLMTFLLDLGVEMGDGQLRFSIETGALNLKRIMARFHFRKTRTVRVGSKEFKFRPGEKIQIFFSYRYTPDQVRNVLTKFGLAVCDQWITDSSEEGVFLCRRASR